MLEQVVCSNLVKCQLLGAQAPTVTLTNCTSTYLQREFALLPAVPVLAVGSPVQLALERLRRQGQLPDAHAVVSMRHPAIVFTDDHHASAVTALRRTLGST